MTEEEKDSTFDLEKILSTLGGRLQYALDARGVAKKSLAEALGTRTTVINRWIRTSTISDVFAKRVCQELNISTDWLVHGKGAPPLKSNVVVIENDQMKLPDDTISVPEYHVSICCGGGAYEPTFEKVQNSLPAFYRRSWCDAKGVDPKYLVRLKAVGDSMMPLINEGDFILIDTSPSAKLYKYPNKIYAFFYEDLLMVKRIIRLEDGSIELTSDNPNYSPVKLTVDEFSNRISIIGRVIERSGSI